jgi:hypothetical protein
MKDPAYSGAIDGHLIREAAKTSSSMSTTTTSSATTAVGRSEPPTLMPEVIAKDV